MNLPVDYNKISSKERKIIREQYMKVQHGLCYFCESRLTGTPDKNVLTKPINKKLFPPGFFRWPIHLHHDHSSGLTLGAVHNQCNAYLWQYLGE